MVKNPEHFFNGGAVFKGMVQAAHDGAIGPKLQTLQKANAPLALMYTILYPTTKTHPVGDGVADFLPTIAFLKFIVFLSF